jgi:K(+)-stimulated pyrophosphate-energized sodium pump
MGNGLIIAIGCAMAALLYGAFSIKWILSLSPGNERMREIATAIQEGASAYLNRQYTTISIVGVILSLIHI